MTSEQEQEMAGYKVYVETLTANLDKGWLEATKAARLASIPNPFDSFKGFAAGIHDRVMNSPADSEIPW